MEAGKRTITDIFNRTRTLAVPFFQRAYVWDEENWDRFLEDMLTIQREKRGYFLGSVILKQLPVPSGAQLGDFRVIVDGQQRLTTTVLFFKALTIARKEDIQFKGNFYDVLGEICLKHNHNDIEVFEAIVNDQLTDELIKEYSENHVLRAFQFFSKQTAKLEQIEPLSLLNHIYFVGIDLGEKEDEQQIFDTINSLGVSLSTAELLKNELFRREDLGLYEQTWKLTFERDEETREYWAREITSGRSRRETIDLLLQSFLAIESGASGEYARVDSLFDNYRRFLSEECRGPENKVAFIKRLQRAANVFRSNIRPDDLETNFPATDRVARLNVFMLGLNTTTVVPYFHFLLLTVEDENERDQMFELLETFLVRRLVCRETTKNYNNFFGALLRNGVNTAAGLRDRLVSVEDSTIPDDDAFRQGWESTNLTNQQARVVLYLLERSARDEAKHSTTPLGLTRYSLEHLMPKKWRNHWGVPEDPAQARARDQLLLKLGNLTLLTSSLNSAIRDADWSKKKRGKGKNDGLDKFAQGLEIFDTELKLEKWDEVAIHKRSDRLFEKARVVWSYPTVQ